MDLPTHVSRMSLFPILGMLGGIFDFIKLINILKANIEDSDQMPLYAVSNLGLHDSPLSHKKVDMLI